MTRTFESLLKSTLYFEDIRIGRTLDFLDPEHFVKGSYNVAFFFRSSSSSSVTLLLPMLLVVYT